MTKLTETLILRVFDLKMEQNFSQYINVGVQGQLW
jgi:hypothetical protein